MRMERTMFILKGQMGMQKPLQTSTIHCQHPEDLRKHTKGMHLKGLANLNCTTTPRFQPGFNCVSLSYQLHGALWHILAAPESAQLPCKACCAIQERGSRV